MFDATSYTPYPTSKHIRCTMTLGLNRFDHSYSQAKFECVEASTAWFLKYIQSIRVSRSTHPTEMDIQDDASSDETRVYGRL